MNRALSPLGHSCLATPRGERRVRALAVQPGQPGPWTSGPGQSTGSAERPGRRSGGRSGNADARGAGRPPHRPGRGTGSRLRARSRHRCRNRVAAIDRRALPRFNAGRARPCSAGSRPTRLGWSRRRRRGCCAQRRRRVPRCGKGGPGSRGSGSLARGRAGGGSCRRGRRGRARYRRHDRGRGRRNDRGLGARRRGWRHCAGREKRGRVDIAVGCRGHADPEVDVGGRPLGFPALAGNPDRITFGDGRAPGDCRLAEVGERDGVAVGLNRHRSARRRHDANERHDAGRRGAHGLAGRPGDVDPPMLPRGVRIRAERVGTEHLSPQRP